MAKAAATAQVINLNDPTNGGDDVYRASQPYVVSVALEGVCDLLMHRWNTEAVAAKAGAAKNSTAKKTDNIESYVYRNDDGEICLPGEYLRRALVGAAKFRQDPRSPRKSAMDLFNAGVIVLTNLSSFGSKNWDYLDTRRVMVQRQGINRTRPAMKMGWKLNFDVQVQTPEYIDRVMLHETLQNAGRLIGLGDFRPTFGRFGIVNFS